jgi:hypothetical protein
MNGIQTNYSLTPFEERTYQVAITGDSQREQHAAVGKETGETARAGALE